MKKFLIAITVLLSILTFSTVTASANTTNIKSLPGSITNQRWYRISSYTEGGYFDQTTFSGNVMKMYNSNGNLYTWKLSSLKQSSKDIFYGDLNYGKTHEAVEIWLKNDYKFLIIPKNPVRMGPLSSKKAYSGTEQFGAMTFTRPKIATIPTSLQGYYVSKVKPSHGSKLQSTLTIIIDQHKISSGMLQADSYTSEATNVTKSGNQYKISYYLVYGPTTSRGTQIFNQNSKNTLYYNKHTYTKVSKTRYNYISKHPYTW